MTTTRLPRYSPFLQGSHCGLPYHGLVRDGILTKINGTTLSYLSVAGHGGEAIPAAGTHAALPTRTPEQVAADEAAGEDWRAYAYLSGRDRNIGGVELGANAWLYNDGNATWKIRAEIVRPVYNDITIKVYLSQLFGRFADDAVALPAEILLGSVAFVPQTINYNTGPPAVYSDYYWDMDVNVTMFAYPKKTGAEALLSIGYGDGASGFYTVPLGNKATWNAYAANVIYGDWSGSFTSLMKTLPNFSSLFGVVKVAITGTGSLVPGSVGNGITATVTNYKRLEDLLTVTYDHYAFRNNIDDTDDTSTTTMVQKFLWTYHPDTQDEQFATYTQTQVHAPVEEPSYPGYLTYLVTIDHVVAFAGESITYEHSGYYTYRPSTGAYAPVLWLGAEGKHCEACPPYVAVDTAYGDRSTLLVEECFPVYDPTATIHTHYVAADGTRFDYSTMAADIGSQAIGYPVPSLAKLHGQVTTSPMEGKLATAGEIPKSVVYV